jgi:hypothetical protein
VTDALRTRSSRPAVILRGLGAVLGWHALLVAAFVAWVLVLPSEHSGAGCDGLGWGCTPNPRDGAIIVGIVFGVPAVAATLLVAGLAAAALGARVRSGLIAGTAATFGTWLAGIAGVLVWLQAHA